MSEHKFKIGDSVVVRESIGLKDGSRGKVVVVDDSAFPYLVLVGNSWEWMKSSEISPAPFGLDDIKAGYLVKVRNNEHGGSDFGVAIRSTVGDNLRFCYEDSDISNTNGYHQDMTEKNNSEFDIVEVWGHQNTGKLSTILETAGRTLLWKRNEESDAKQEKLRELERTIEKAQEQIKELKEA